jgi:hypothetical protein
MIFSAEHRLMAQEGHLASSSLLAGFEALAKINYDKPGTIYSTLFHLSIGLERMMKIAVILDHKAMHNLANPTDKQLRGLGHSITDLYAKVRTAGEARGNAGGWFDQDTDHHDLLAALSEFARGSRYYNFDQLVNGSQNPDPIVRWFKVHMQIAESVLPYRRLEKIMTKARAFCDTHHMYNWEWGPMGRYDLTVDVTYQVEVARVTRGHCVWTIVETILPIYRLIDHLTKKVHHMENQSGITSSAVPYMTEFFPFCLATRKSAVRRKAWATLFHFAGR